MPTIDYQTLRRVTQAIIEAAGTPPEAAQAVCESLVEANLRGHDSHGVMRVPQYVDFLRKGTYKAGVIEEDYRLNLPTGTVPAEEYQAFVERVHVVDDGFMAGIRVKK